MIEEYIDRLIDRLPGVQLLIPIRSSIEASKQVHTASSASHPHTYTRQNRHRHAVGRPTHSHPSKMPPFPPPSPRLLLLLLLLALSLSSCVLPSLAATADATAGDDAAPPGSTITDPNEAAAALIAAADAQAEAEAAPLAPPPPGVSHEFGALNTLLLVLVLGLCILSAYLVRVNRFYYLPE